ncbi:RDD family protein [Arenimonas fontis]|uniref:RDD family protein n=1 Tax=Arenimonas fontis TaxID=2608255 RepID=A0A5B2ZAU9_9GAMM|nr:RDD family protein [Arenimonas fontis]KAA2284271.1 RDD family protein [Arenimonas fontis]
MATPAGFWRRYAAYSLDAVAIALLALPLAWPRLKAAKLAYDAGLTALQMRLWELLDAAFRAGLDPGTQLLDWSRDPVLRAGLLDLAGVLAGAALATAACLMAVAALWFVAGEASPWQASPGKRALGLKVTTLAGERPGLLRVIGRFLAGLPSWLLLNLGHALAGWRKDKRALHDLIAGTRVMLADGAPVRMPRWARVWLGAQAVLFFAGVGWVLLNYLRLAWEVLRDAL